MHGSALEQALGSHRSETCRSDQPSWPLALHVLFWLVKDLLGIRPVV